MKQLPDTSTEAGQREASVMLARLIPDWSVHNDWQITTPEGYGLRNLYKPSEMAQAWKVICWLVDPKNDPFFVWFKEEDRSRFYAGLQWRSWWSANSHDYYNDTAQRAWLDNALIFAINAGMLEAQP